MAESTRNQSVSQNHREWGAKGLWSLLRVARWVCADDGVSGLGWTTRGRGKGDWAGRRGTVISGSCRKLAVLPPFDSRESIFQVRSRLAHWHSYHVLRGIITRLLLMYNPWIDHGYILARLCVNRKRAVLGRFLGFDLPTDYSYIRLLLARLGIFRERILEEWRVWIVSNREIETKGEKEFSNFLFNLVYLYNFQCGDKISKSLEIIIFFVIFVLCHLLHYSWCLILISL